MKSTIKTLCCASLLAIIISACGGGGGGSSTPTPTQTTQPTPKNVTIDAEGDSTIYGLQLDNGQYVQTPNNAPVELQIDLRAALGNTVSVTNSGVPGATIAESLAGTAPYSGTPFAQRLAAMPSSVQIVIANFGINDANLITSSAYESGLESFITAVRAAGKTPILEEPNPICSTPEQSANLDTFVPIMDAVAKQQSVPLIEQYYYIKSLPGWQGMLPDCIHPNDALYKIKADRETSVLRPIVQQLMD